ncbi:hypothetical protein [Alienimonas sp. DA493]|uniref:hypothetical protein n=1 Tax=Alienimonas sp. DA493 TaxID=3373605 RepID=UPI00375426FC
MATLTIDDETYSDVRRAAERCGLTVEQWLLETASAGLSDDAAPGAELARWEEWLEAFAADHGATGLPLDDSRESIYR